MRIFISHSTAKSDANGRQRLDDLAAALSPHEALWDRKLEPGAEWRADLDEWMACCHSAVLLLDRVALRSWWVLKEATILAHRASLDKKFLLFPALLDGVTRDDLSRADSPFSKLYLEAIQRLSKNDAAGIADQVKQQLALLASAPATPIDRLAARIAAQLRNSDSSQLETICTAVTGQPVQWSPQESRAERCGREIARAIVRGDRGSYRSLRALISALRTAGITREAAKATLESSASLWIAGSAAAPLTDLAQRNLDGAPAADASAECWATALNAAYGRFTADKYVLRAFLPESPFFCSIEGGEGDSRAEELIHRILLEVPERVTALKGADVKAVDRFLSKLTNPFFVLLPPPAPREGVLRALQRKFPRVTFIMHTGDELVPGDSAWPVRVVPLEPAVNLDAEQVAFEDFSGATYDIEQT